METRRVPNNLPKLLNRLIGRDRELAEIAHRLAHTRLLTLTGAGGCGKTRLAIEAGGRQLEGYPDGVWIVDFAAIRSASQVLQAIAQALKATAEGAQPLEAVLLRYFQNRVLLLILDNCEHVVEEAARVAWNILSNSSDDLRILVTSQIPLGIPGELEWAVSPLQMPEAVDEPLDLPGLLAYSAPRLFLERAQEVDPGFTVGSDQVKTLAEICRRLDGIPLAIELAAARVKLLSLEQMESRLARVDASQGRADDSAAAYARFSLLSSGKRMTSRHQTMQAAIEWSYGLLTTPQQALLNRLSVFTGSWTLAAAEAVCGDEPLANPGVFERLSQLVDRSLVEVVHSGDRQTEKRYRLLESIRWFAWSNNAEAERLRLGEQHLAWYTQAAERTSAHLHEGEQLAWIRQAESDLPNHLAALEWAAHFAPPDPRLLLGLRLAGALAGYALGRSPSGLIHAWLEEALQRVGQTAGPEWIAARATAWRCLGLWARMKGWMRKAQEQLETSRDLWASLGKEGLAGYALASCYLESLPDLTGTGRTAGEFQEAMALFKELGDEWGQALAMFHHGANLMGLTQAEEPGKQGKRLCELALALFRKAGDRQGQAWVHKTLGDYFLDHEKYPEALSHYQHSQRLMRDLHFLQGQAQALGTLGDVFLLQRQLSQAEETYGQLLPLAEQTGIHGGIAFAYIRMGQIRLLEQQYSEARRCFLVALQTLHQELNQAVGEHLMTWGGLYGLGAALAPHDPEHAARLQGKALLEVHHLGGELAPVDIHPAREILEAVAAKLGRERYRALQNEGARLSLEELLTNLPDETGTSPAPRPEPARIGQRVTLARLEKLRYSGLTLRERDIAALIAEGKNNAEIAACLYIAVRTVETHVTNILNKLNYSSRTQIAVWATGKAWDRTTHPAISRAEK